ncbi:MAG TPA: phosphotransferase, partial [Thermomicrobiales bacterium]|nr:phosphotransferase [Thermomicrobiales bacterium]
EVAVAVEGALAGHRTIVAYESGLFDAQSWMPGREATRIPPVTSAGGGQVSLPVAFPTQLVLESAGLIARFHAATTGVASGQDRPTTTLRGFGSVSNRAWRSLQHRLDPLAPRLLPVRRWRAAGRRVVRDALAKIEEAGAEGEVADVVIHGDLWPAHVLSTRRGEALNVTGIVDWTDATAGSPLVDIAQLITHFGGWTPENAESVLAAYHDIRPLGPTERRLLPSVAALDLVAETGWLLQIGYFDEDELGQGQRSFVRTGADTLIQSLETLANVLEFGETSPPRQVRRWVHREPSGGKTARRRGGKGR